MAQARALEASFVDLSLSAPSHGGRERAQHGGAPDERRVKVSDILLQEDHCVILGRPGAGKTTTLKRVAGELIQSSGREVVLILFRTFVEQDTIVDQILNQLGLHLSWNATDATKVEPDIRAEVATHLLLTYLESTAGVLLMDGLDEAPASSQERIVNDVRGLLLRSGRLRIILTCRSGAFPYALERARHLVIQPLSPAEVKEFAIKWLGSANGTAFVANLASTPYSGIEVRPLTLAHLCTVYERTGAVPERPRDLYRRVVRLYLEDWDRERSVPSRASRYAQFNVDRKEDFLQALAYELTVAGVRGEFSHSQLIAGFRRIYKRFDLPLADAQRVAEEIESHTGLVVESGRDTYEFAHRSIQEYLTAQYIIGLPKIALDHFESIFGLADEYAIAVAESGHSSSYLQEIIRYLYAGTPHQDQERLAFVRGLSARLVLEKPFFHQGASFGGAIVQLAHLISGRRLDDRYAEGVLDPILSFPSVRASVALFLSKSRLSREGAIVYVAPDWDLLDPKDSAAYTDLIKMEGPLAAFRVPSTIVERCCDERGSAPPGWYR
jgi:energy-coupling factor transporter ATP-binding protein EcfA2